MNKIETKKVDGKPNLNYQDEYDQYEDDDEEDLSPDFRSKTHLGMKQKDIKDIESKVRDHIRRNSKKPVYNI